METNTDVLGWAGGGAEGWGVLRTSIHKEERSELGGTGFFHILQHCGRCSGKVSDYGILRNTEGTTCIEIGGGRAQHSILFK